MARMEGKYLQGEQIEQRRGTLFSSHPPLYREGSGEASEWRGWRASTCRGEQSEQSMVHSSSLVLPCTGRAGGTGRAEHGTLFISESSFILVGT